MRRDEIIRSTNTIIRDIRESGIFSMINRPIGELRGARSDGKTDTSWFNLAVFQDYSVRTSTYTDDQNAILSILELDNLSNPKFWEPAFRGGGADEFVAARNSVRFVLDQLPKVVSLLERETDRISSGIDHGPLSDKAIFSIYLPEEAGEHSSPERVLFAISSISDIYYAISQIHGHSVKDLVLLSCDSGSDKVFDFAGSGEMIREVKELVLGLWDRVVFHRHNQSMSNFAAIAATLPIIEEISKLESENKIDSETSGLLKHKLISASTKFLEAGTLTAEMDKQGHQSPRALMRPQPKLLLGPSQAIQPSGEVEHPLTEEPPIPGRFSNLTPDDIAALKIMLGEQPEKPASRRTAVSRPRKK